MNKKGIFCFLLLLCFLGIQIAMQKNTVENQQIFSQAEALCFELEKVDLKRTVLEENLDFLVREAMLEEAKKQNFDSEKIKKRVNEKLLEFFSAVEKETGTGFFGVLPLSLKYLNSNSEALAIHYNGFWIVEYNYTGGVLKSNFLRAKIELENSEKEFELPVGYIQKITVLE